MKMNDSNAGESEKETLSGKLRSAVITGIFVVIPIFLSLWIGWVIYDALTSWGVMFADKIPAGNISPFWRMQLIRVLCLVCMLAMLILAGALTKIALGQKLLRIAQKMLLKVPVINFIYSTSKQIGDAVWGAKGGNMFHRAVLIEYPRRGSWTVGFLTNENKKSFEVTEKLSGREMYSVFIPTTPNPTSGFLFFLPKEDCILLDMSVADAMKLIVSCGGVLPQAESDAGTAEKNGED